METVYYYKNIDDEFVFSDGQRLTGPKASYHIRVLQKAGKSVERLYLDVEEDWDTLKAEFEPEHWIGKTWQDVYMNR
jgi:hypothetical protein